MAYKVNMQCSVCGRRFSYLSTAKPEAKVCPAGPHSDRPKSRKRAA